MTDVMTIGNAFTSPAQFGNWFAGSSWDGWRAILRAAFAETMSRKEIAFFRSVAYRDPPPQRVKEFWVCAGGRAGKDSAISGVVAHLAATFDARNRLRPGERVQVACLAVSREQAQTVLTLIKAFFELVPALKSMVRRETADGLELSNSVDIQILTGDFRSARSRTTLALVFDEIAFWPGAGTSSPDLEIYRGLRPSMLTLKESMLIGISTCYTKQGLLYDRWLAHFGKNTKDILVVQAPSVALNPTLPAEEIAQALLDDPEAAKADYLSQWRCGDRAGCHTPAIRPEARRQVCFVVGLLRRPLGFHDVCDRAPRG
jgi:hypothetical protein